MHLHIDAVAAAKLFQHSLLALYRIDILLLAPLKRRIARLAQAAGRTPHSLMAEALEQKADELEAQAAFTRLAAARDLALQAGQKTLDWHDMKVWLRSTVKTRTATAKAAGAKARGK